MNGHDIACPSYQKRQTTTSLQMKSGGIVALNIDVDVGTLPPDERAWLFGVIDKFREYTDRS